MEGDYLQNKNNSLDWKNYNHEWPYSSDAPKNRKWKKDRSELFKRNGNGWWYYHGYNVRESFLSEIDKINMQNTKKWKKDLM